MVVGEFVEDADVVIVGGGPAGYACAFSLAKAGRSITIIDPRPTLGGLCLHEGCIPTKALLHAIALAPRDETPDFADAQRQITSTQRRLGAGLGHTATQHNIRVVRGNARFLSSREIQVFGDQALRLRFKRAVVCTGSERRAARGLPKSVQAISPGAFATQQCPPTSPVMVLGTSAIAVESAAIAAGFGAATTLLCDGNPLLPHIPRDLVEPFIDQASFAIGNDDPAAIPEGTLVVDALSRRAQLDDLELTNTSVTTEDGWIEVNDRMQTSDPRIFAAGDCTGEPLWAGAALHQGRIAADAILGGHAAWDAVAVPQVIFAAPEICWTGSFTGPSVESLVVPWTFSGLAMIQNHTHGRTMICWERDTTLLVGAGACGAGACDLADAFAIAIEMGATLQDLADIVPAHPTRTELLGEAARKALS